MFWIEEKISTPDNKDITLRYFLTKNIRRLSSNKLLTDLSIFILGSLVYSQHND